MKNLNTQAKVKPLRYMGDRPHKCDICGRDLTKAKYFIDGNTQFGSWATMCTTCHKTYGKGLGTGKGQKYNRETLEKVEDKKTAAKKVSQSEQIMREIFGEEF